jgi:hypothetical protein
MMRMVLMLILLTVLPLAACNDTPPAPCPPPPVVVKTVIVNVPIATPCIDPALVPVEPSKVGDRLSGDAGHDLGLVSSSALGLRIWGRQILALVQGCEASK